MGTGRHGGVGDLKHHYGGRHCLHGLQRYDRAAGITVVNPGQSDRFLRIVFDTCTQVMDPVGQWPSCFVSLRLVSHEDCWLIP